MNIKTMYMYLREIGKKLLSFQQWQSQKFRSGGARLKDKI